MACYEEKEESGELDLLRCLPKFLVTSGLWAQHAYTGNSKEVCSKGSQMNVTVWVGEYEQNGQSTGLIHSTM